MKTHTRNIRKTFIRKIDSTTFFLKQISYFSSLTELQF